MELLISGMLIPLGMTVMCKVLDIEITKVAAIIRHNPFKTTVVGLLIVNIMLMLQIV